MSKGQASGRQDRLVSRAEGPEYEPLICDCRERLPAGKSERDVVEQEDLPIETDLPFRSDPRL